MKELKFTPENLDRHLKAYPYNTFHTAHYIYTVRDERKGDCGDVFFIKGAGLFVLLTAAEFVPRLADRKLKTRLMWRKEGFDNPDEFSAELKRLYGEAPEKLYYHRLLKINEESL